MLDLGICNMEDYAMKLDSDTELDALDEEHVNAYNPEWFLGLIEKDCVKRKDFLEDQDDIV